MRAAGHFSTGGMTIMQKLTMTIAETVLATGLSRTTIYNLIQEGKLTPRKAGKRTLIMVSELEAFLADLPIGGPGHES